MDAYRLQGEVTALFDELDLESLLPTSITVVEWGEGLANRLSDEYLEIKIGFGNLEDQRELLIIGHGARFESFAI